jgi:hypothetical protein
MLEGDNMYTCSKCQKKVRAEKRQVHFNIVAYLWFIFAVKINDIKWSALMLTIDDRGSKRENEVIFKVANKMQCLCPYTIV